MVCVFCFGLILRGLLDYVSRGIVIDCRVWVGNRGIGSLFVERRMCGYTVGIIYFLGIIRVDGVDVVGGF